MIAIDFCNSFLYFLKKYKTNMKARNEYEIKAEIIVKQLKAKIYDLEAKALEAKFNAKTGLGELERKIKSLKNQRENLDQKFDGLKNASKEKWEILVSEFEEFVSDVNNDKHNFSEKAELWIAEFSIRIDELEYKAKNANEELKHKIKGQIENIKNQKKILEEKLTELKESQDGNWQKLQDGFDENLSKVKDSISRAFDYFKK